jgi:hypothetical protein
MNRQWHFTDLEFVVQWEAVQNDYLPPPLSWASNLPTWDRLNHAKAMVREQLRRTGDSTFAEVLEVLVAPDIRVGVRLMGGTDRADPGASVRILGVRKADRGFVVRQLPGETIWHSGGFVITECDAIGLAEAIVANLPEVPAGKLPYLELTTQRSNDPEHDDVYRRSRVLDSFEEPADGVSGRFREAPVDTVGFIEICHGVSRFGPRGMVRRRLTIRDLTGDGRYLITTGETPTARGADGKRMIAMINGEIATVVRAIRDDRL